MNWDAIGAIGEIVGTAAVVASLLYLAVQTRSNARSLRAKAIWDAENMKALADEFRKLSKNYIPVKDVIENEA